MATSLSVDEWETAVGNFGMASFFFFMSAERRDACGDVKGNGKVRVTKERCGN